ncbi:MAG TPA: sulfurtransferase [Mycobacteriales bacterium]|nr:sulfurtransferase [Mycobacteriales bacterium]
MEALVSAPWLAENLDGPGLRVFDATLLVRRRLFVPTVRTGHREWRRAHIPGSSFASLFALSDPTKSRRSITFPSAEHFAAVIGALGVATDSRVVIYDRRDNMWAARLWWMLRAFGLDDAAVLDGGWSAWQRGGYPVCTQPCSYPPATFAPTPRRGLVVGKREVLNAIDDPDVCLVNALGRRQHRGEVNEYGRRGHIPGSRNVTAWEVLDRETHCYRPLPELRGKVGTILDAPRVITYCGAGAAAASIAHVLTRLGHTNVAVYDGGLLEWCADRDLPLEVGA